MTACGGGSGSTNNPTPTPAPAKPTVPPTPTAGFNTQKAFINTTQTTINGKSETILTFTAGQTIYYHKTDPAPESNCTDGCALTWPPVLYPGKGAPTTSQKLPGKLTVHTTQNGPQVEYNNHPLYLYVQDLAPGQMNGAQVSKDWAVVPTDLP